MSAVAELLVTSKGSIILGFYHEGVLSFLFPFQNSKGNFGLTGGCNHRGFYHFGTSRLRYVSQLSVGQSACRRRLSLVASLSVTRRGACGLDGLGCRI